MKPHTENFKSTIKEMGRELRGIITHGNDILEEEIMAITPHFEGSILKSVMKQLDLELSVDIDKGEEINCQIGIYVDGLYEMLDFGNYIVYSSEKQEDTNTYKLVCYDKLLYSMKQNEDLGVTYPITIKNYLTALASKIGLSVASGTFNNQALTIDTELYVGLEYTYRDILDEIAQATGSIIYLNTNDEIVVKYPTTTGDTIDEEFLRDVNVDFAEKYGPINSIVLSRAGESDNVYLRDEESVTENGLCEIKIVDNQIMNFNNRSDFLQGILGALDGLEYYINDFNSTGILYYEVGDLYNIQIGENTYNCIMLNDEINVTQGIEELIHTDLPEQSETDYSKADKTDRRINQTYIIVDKQNQTIESVVSSVSEQNSKISQITQTVDEINSKIQDIADITKAEESSAAVVNLTDINESEPIMVKIHSLDMDVDYRISYLYPSNSRYPSGNGYWYLPCRTLRFKRTYEEDGVTKTQNIDYELPDDLLYYNNTHYDEFYLDYDSQTCQVIKRCKYDQYFNVEPLSSEVVTDYPYPQILLGDGDYEVSVLTLNRAYIYVRLMAQNIYTTQFATNAKLTSEIDQTAEGLRVYVDEELSNYTTTNDMNTLIDITARGIKTEVSQTYATKDTTNSLSTRISQTAKSIELTANDNGTSAGLVIKLRNEDGSEISSDDANITLSGKVAFTNLTDGRTTISGSNIKTGTIDASQVNVTNINANNITSGTISGSKISGGTIDGNNVTIKNLDASKITTGTLSASKISGGTLNGNNMTVTNLKASSITTGTLNGINLKNGSISSASISGTSISGGSLSNTPYSYSGDSSDTVSISSSTSGTIEGYYGSKSSSNRRYSLKAFTSGGRFQSFNSSGGQASYFDHNGPHTISDIRLKNNISNINEEVSLNIINNLNPIEFTYKSDENVYHRGLSAQDVEEVLKENNIDNEIYEIRENGEYSLNYVEIIPDLINCIKYLTKEIEKLKGGK